MRVSDRVSSETAARILIVEDEARIASFLARALGSCGFAAESACDGVAALEMLKHNPFDLVLLDLLLPQLDGFAVLASLAQLDAGHKVVVLSTLSDVESKVRCFELGASDYMTKPFSVGELVARVRAHLQRSQDTTPVRFLENGPLRLDLQRRAVVTDGRRIDLSTREFLLLEYLMRKQGAVCSRAELLESVWGYAFDPGTNIVAVYVRRLRRKLGDDAIETIRSVGYACAAA